MPAGAEVFMEAVCRALEAVDSISEGMTLGMPKGYVPRYRPEFAAEVGRGLG